MAVSFREIRASIDAELKLFEKKFEASVKSKVPLLDKVMYYIVQRKGKQMRPMFVFLSAKISGQINESTYRGAALVELLHTATLIHDDVVDDAYQRRGFFSVNALWKNKVAVLVGDYLLSKGLLLSLDNGDFELLQIVSRAVRDMSEGELLQMEHSRRLNVSEAVYYDIIRKKTATLIASACSVGAASVGGNASQFWQIGETIGMAFQIRDDLLDLGDEETGKPHGIDIQEKKLTLPIIYALQNASSSDKQRIIYLVKNHHNNKAKINEVVQFVQQSGGIDYARQKMQTYIDQAMQLFSQLPPSETLTALKNLVEYTISRSH